MNMLTGRFARQAGENVITASMWLQVGANMDQRKRVYIGTMTSDALGMRNLSSRQIISMSTPDQANRSIGVLDAALKVVNKQRADLGAYQNRLDYIVKGLDVGAQNLQASESLIRDADMAQQMVDYTKDIILSQSATAMLAQANQKPRQVLQLLQ
jgi:flagellin